MSTMKVFYSPLKLHIPDGFLSIPVSLLFWGASILAIAIALRKVKKESIESNIPMMGILSAFIFAAQLINFPVAGGTSGHLIGGAFASILLGPSAGILIMTSVVALQAFMFQDGGILTLGANLFNMGILTSLIATSFHHFTKQSRQKTFLAASFLASFLGVLAASTSTALQLWLSHTAPAQLIFSAMFSVHFFIAIGEGLITTAALAFILKVQPGILGNVENRITKTKTWSIFGIIISLILVLISPFASLYPDGLESVANDLGFSNQAAPAMFELFPNYNLPSGSSPASATWLAPTIGLLTLLVLGGTIYIINSQKNKKSKLNDD